jgi:hypothetical protein
MSAINQPQRNLFADPTVWFLLFSNLVTIFLAVKDGWNLSTVMLVYWFQSVTIGFFNFIRILQLKEFSTEDLKINGRFVQPTRAVKISTAFFFLFSYGIFHAVYLIFLRINFGKFLEEGINLVEGKFVFLAALLFFINHLFSFIYNKSRDKAKQNIGILMFYPYARVFPMHLMIILGYLSKVALPFFLVLKTFSDIVMHIVERQIRKSEEFKT